MLEGDGVHIGVLLSETILSSLLWSLARTVALII